MRRRLLRAGLVAGALVLTASPALAEDPTTVATPAPIATAPPTTTAPDAADGGTTTALDAATTTAADPAVPTTAATPELAADPNGCGTRLWDPSGRLGDTTALLATIGRLVASGIDLHVRIETTTDGGADARQAQLEQVCEGWRVAGDRAPRLLVLMVLPDDRQTGLYYGREYGNALAPNWLDIQQTAMNPRFKEGAFGVGLVAGLEQIELSIAGRRVPSAAQPATAPSGGSGGSGGSGSGGGSGITGAGWVFLVLVLVAIVALRGKVTRVPGGGTWSWSNGSSDRSRRFSSGRSSHSSGSSGSSGSSHSSGGGSSGGGSSSW